MLPDVVTAFVSGSALLFFLQLRREVHEVAGRKIKLKCGRSDVARGPVIRLVLFRLPAAARIATGYVLA